MELEYATIDDIVSELRRRKLHFALVIDQMAAYKPGGDIPSEDRGRSYGSDANPLRTACEFCQGIKWALNDVSKQLPLDEWALDKQLPMTLADLALAVLSGQVKMVQDGIHTLIQLDDALED